MMRFAFLLLIAFLLSNNATAQLSHTWRVGSENITRYVSNPNGPPPGSLNGNIMCIESRMDTPFDAAYLTAAPVTDRTFGSHESIWGSFLYIATVNHRGRKDFSTLSETLTGHFAEKELPLASIRYCVNHEKLFGVNTQPSLVRTDIIVDWLIFIGNVTYGSKAGAAKVVFPVRPLEPYSCQLFKIRNKYLSSVALTTVQVNFAGVTPYEIPSWTDSIEGSDVRVCISTHLDSGISTRPSTNVTSLIMNNTDLPLNSGALANSPLFYHEVNSIPLFWPTTGDIRVVCVDVLFKKSFTYVPLIYGGVSFAPKAFNNLVAEEAVTNWVEFVTESGFRGCVARMRYAGLAPPSISPSFQYLATSRNSFIDNVNNQYKIAATGVVTFKNVTRSILYWKLRWFSLFDHFNTLLSDATGFPKARFFTRLYGWSVDANLSDFSLFFNFKPTSADPDNQDYTKIASNMYSKLPTPLVAYPLNYSPSSFGLFSYLLYDNKASLNRTSNYTVDVYLFCTYTPYTGSICSSSTCGGENNGGNITLSRAIRGTPSNRSDCTRLNTVEPCNRAPCNLVDGQIKVFRQGGVFPSQSSNLTWLWAVIGVIAGLVLIGVGVWMFMRGRKMDGRSRIGLLGGATSIKKSSLQVIGT